MSEMSFILASAPIFKVSPFELEIRPSSWSLEANWTCLIDFIVNPINGSVNSWQHWIKNMCYAILVNKERNRQLPWICHIKWIRQVLFDNWWGICKLNVTLIVMSKMLNGFWDKIAIRWMRIDKGKEPWPIAYKLWRDVAHNKIIVIHSINIQRFFAVIFFIRVKIHTRVIPIISHS